MDIHAYFDLSYDEHSNLVQADENATYYFSKVSQRSASRYQFVSIPHLWNKKPPPIWGTIYLEGYQVFGMCQNNGTLDYVVGLHLNTNEIHVIRFQYDADIDQATVKDYKKVDKDNINKKLIGSLYVDCSFQSKFKGQNSYVIAIAGSYFHSNAISSFYLAKFSTKYNFTEYIYLSEDPEIMESARGVKVDFDNEMVYVAVEINKQKYHDRTVYQPGELPGEDNANVAVHGFSWTHGIRQWTTVLGNVNFTDKYARMQNYGNYLYVFLNSFSTQYSTNSSQTDIYYYRLRAWNGFIEAQKIFGSPTDDRIYDLRITYNGLYILAQIGDQLFPHKYNDRIWQTQSKKQNLGIVWMDFNDDILDIEAFSFDKVPNPFPMKLFVSRSSDINQTFILVGPRSNAEIDLNGGFYFTFINQSDLLYTQTLQCPDGCRRCNPQLTTKCLDCKDGYILHHHTCYANLKCPDFTFNVFDQANKALRYCEDCHYSCRTCSGPKADQCTTCCTNNGCGPIKNRNPNLGMCDCPTGTADSNGLCVQRCVLNLAGKRGKFCYPQCPGNSNPLLKYDQSSAQERSQYDSSSQTDCEQSVYHLKFNQQGKGLAVKGPPDMTQIPNEFTISFWVRPTTLNANSYFVNAFNRVHVKAAQSTQKVFFVFKTGTSTQIEPLYTNDFKQKVVLDAWNYISVSLRQFLDGTIMRYEQILAIANNNMGIVYKAGSDNTQVALSYPFFQNTIYLGSFSDLNPQSFLGYMKEFKFFTKFHGYPQMQDEQLRMYRYYSYDDANLVAYWKLNEPYNTTDIEYTIKDYSINQKSITYSKISKPDYPQFIFDQSFALSLCTFHDVRICESVDYSQTHPYVVNPKRLTQPPTFQLKDLSIMKTNGDQIWFVPNNTECVKSNMLAYMQYQGTPVNDWVISDQNYNPINLKMGFHYQVCYYIASTKVAFNLYQTYVIAVPETVDPSSSDAFTSDGVTRSFGTSGGDQGYGDVIKFSEDCQQPDYSDYEMQRSTKPNFGTHIIKNFAKGGDFFFCWQPTFVQETPNPYYETINDLRFRVVSVPSIATNAPSFAVMNEDMVRFDLLGSFADGDKLAVSWRGNIISDCNPDNFIGSQFVRNFSHWPSVWFGYETGVFGVKNSSMDELHLCYMSAARDAPQAWSRIKKSTGPSYQIRVRQYSNAVNQKCPELLSFNPLYGSSELTESDTVIKFNFKNQAIYPSRQTDGPPVQYGFIFIYRGAVKPDGTIVKTTDVLWSHTTLNDYATPDPFQQGDLICSGSGQCQIILSQTVNRMKAGEIYFISFYKKSFAAKPAPSFARYYLFNTKTLDTGVTSAYDHLFFCRSFTISSSDQMVNGRTFQMTGTDLKSKAIRAKESAGAIVQAVFSTKAINLQLKVRNTIDPYCILNPPVASISLENVIQTSFSVYNLELRQCNEGMLYADIEVVRGIQDQYGVFTHIRSEWQKNVKIGNIGCDSSCMFCNGTTSSHCTICSNPTNMILNGVCHSQCPSTAPFYVVQEMVYQKKKFPQGFCLQECPLGYYPDPQTKQCYECNDDCQTCDSNYIASCLTCEPVKYHFNGVCISDCPGPLYQNNFTSYNCDQLQQNKFLKVKIQTLGYKTRIPKDVQTYLKAAIQNDGGGSILSILWEQLEPIPTTDEMTVFVKNSDGDVDNRASVIKLKMTALNFMSSNQVVKVKVTVYNSLGEVAFDIYEFYQNQPPVVGNFTLTVMNGTGNGTTVDSIYRLQAFNWIDNEGGKLQYKLYLKVDQVYYTVTDLYQTSDFYFRIPLFSSSFSSKNIQLCLAVGDNYDGYSYYCQVIMGVSNNLEYTTNFEKLKNHLLNLNYIGNMTNMVYAANMLYFAMDSPLRPQPAPGLCSLDYHCNFGQCVSRLGNQKCICDKGYSGTFCQFRGSQLPDFQNITSRIVNSLYTMLKSRYEILSTDVELVGNILRGILKDPDIVDDQLFETVIQISEFIGQASIYAHYPVTTEIRNIYLDGLTAILNKLFHSYKVQRALPKTQALSKRGSLYDQYAYMNQATKGIPDAIPNLLIGGVKPKLLKLLANMSADSDPSLVQYQTWGRRIDGQLNSFIDKFMRKLNPLISSYSYTSTAFQILVQSGMASEFKDKLIYIREKDVSWYLPSTVFDGAQGRASDKHEVQLKVMKYIANPFLFERQPGAFVETNVTTLTFFESGGQHINVTLTPDTSDFIQIQEPYRQVQAYDSTLLRCMAWDDSKYEFVNDGSCAFNKIWSPIPCISCDEGTIVNTTVALCRCKHLSRFAIVYMQTVPSKGAGVQIGVYSDFFAMQYWRESFGFYLVIVLVIVYAAGLLFFSLIDRKTKVFVIEKLRERVRRLELKGFKQKSFQPKKFTLRRDADGNIIFKRNNKTGALGGPGGQAIVSNTMLAPGTAAPPVLGPDGYPLPPEQQPQNEVQVSQVMELKKADESKKAKKPSALTGGKAKKINMDEDLTEVAQEISSKKDKKDKKKDKKKAKKGAQDLSQSMRKPFKDETDEFNTSLRNDNDPESEFQNIMEDAEKKKRDMDLFEQQMHARYEDEKYILKFVKVHGTSSSEEDTTEKERSRDQKRYLKLERKAKEIYWYNWKSLLIHGNYILSLFYVSSYLGPRHARWTLLFTCSMLNMFWCAVIYNNTKDPLALPEFDRQARNLAGDDLWIAIIAPMGSTILMYIFAALFKLSDARINQSYTMVYLEAMLKELEKEIKLRFLIAYMITVAIYAAILWYIVKFTATFGWKVSWVWWYSCLFAMFFQYVIIDNLISMIHWITYYCSISLAQFWMKIRLMKQSKTEGV